MIGLGFDSGGTHTTYAVADGTRVDWPDGNECRDSISSARGDESTKEAIDWIHRKIKQRQDDDLCVWIGAAGFSGANASAFRELFAPLVQDVQDSGRRCEVFLANDAVSILKAPPLLGNGVAAIVGTGSVVLGAHPRSQGVVKRGGCEWLVSDEGSGVWMTLECIKRLLRDVQAGTTEDFHSPLLDRLVDEFQIKSPYIAQMPRSHRALASVEMLARKLSEGREDLKRDLAGFIYPDLFGLALGKPGQGYDRIAAEVLDASVGIIVKAIDEVSTEVAAHSADAKGDRDRVDVVVGGNIAANDAYAAKLVPAAHDCRYVGTVETVGDAAGRFAELAWLYLTADGGVRNGIRARFDALHPVLQLL